MTAPRYVDRTTDDDATFAQQQARWEVAPAALESAHIVEDVARAMWLAEHPAIARLRSDQQDLTWRWKHRDRFTRLAVAAVAAVADHQQQAAQAVGRVLALADELIGEARKAAASADPELTHPYINAACRIRAAVAGQP